MGVPEGDSAPDSEEVAKELEVDELVAEPAEDAELVLDAGAETEAEDVAAEVSVCVPDPDSVVWLLPEAKPEAVGTPV